MAARRQFPESGVTMKRRIKALDYRQKWILLIMGAMVLVFTILYPVTLSRVGYSYRDAILVPHEAEGTTVYSGKLQ